MPVRISLANFLDTDPDNPDIAPSAHVEFWKGNQAGEHKNEVYGRVDAAGDGVAGVITGTPDVEPANEGFVHVEEDGTSRTIGWAKLRSDLAQEVTDRQSADAAEAAARQSADNSLQAQITANLTSSIQRGELSAVLTNISYTASGVAVVAHYTVYNAVTKTTSTLDVALPVASGTQQGVMTKEAYQALQDVVGDVANLEAQISGQGGYFLGVSFATKAALNAYAVPPSIHVSDFTYVLDDETHSGALTRYIWNGTAWEYTFTVEYDPPGLATATTPGLVKGSAAGSGNAGKIFVELDGSMSVIGWSGTQQQLSRTVLTNLSTTTPANDTGNDIQPGVTGTLPIANGGTSATTTGTALGALARICPGNLLSSDLAYIAGMTGGMANAGLATVSTVADALNSGAYIGNGNRLARASDVSALEARVAALEASSGGGGSVGFYGIAPVKFNNTDWPATHDVSSQVAAAQLAGKTVVGYVVNVSMHKNNSENGCDLGIVADAAVSDSTLKDGITLHCVSHFDDWTYRCGSAAILWRPSPSSSTGSIRTAQMNGSSWSSGQDWVRITLWGFMVQ